MKINKNFCWPVFMSLLLFVNTFSAGDILFTIPVYGMLGDSADRNRVSGLALTVEDMGWPAFSMLWHPCGTIGSLDANLSPMPLSFGTFRLAGVGKLAEQQSNDVSNTLTFRNQQNDTLKVTLTRLSPAVLLENTSSELELFAGPDKQAGKAGGFPLPAGTVKPLCWATPSGDGTVAVGILGASAPVQFPKSYMPVPSQASGNFAAPPVDDLGRTWLLLWYGSGSPFLGSKVPLVFIPNEEGKTAALRMKTVFQADVPLLLIFEKAPQSIELRRDGNASRLVASYPGMAGKMAVLPLFGHDVQAAAVTEKWLTIFPEEIKARCDGWAKRLGDFPVNVKEKITYNEKADRVTSTETFEYIKVRPGGDKTVLVRPMLALGLQQKLPVVVTPPPADLKYATQFGPLLAVPGDHYQWHLDGLGKYVNAKPVFGPSNVRSAELEKELTAEVDKVLDAGHLAPWVVIWAMPWVPECGTTYFRDPSAALYFLSEVMPVLPEEQQVRVRQYLKSEAGAYPPDQVRQLKVFEGAPRDFFQVPADLVEGYNRPLGKKETRVTDEYYEPVPSLFRAYGAACYCLAVNQKPEKAALDYWSNAMRESLVGRQWDTMGWFRGKYAARVREQPGDSLADYRSRYLQFTPRAIHRDAAGLMGYLRLCRQAGKKAEPEAWGQLARLMAMRYALAEYGRYLDESGLFQMPKNPDVAAFLARSCDLNKPENHFEQVWEVNQHEVTMLSGVSKESPGYGTPFIVRFPAIHYQPVFRDMIPEIGRALSDWGLKADIAGYLKHYAELQPIWYQSHADCTHISGSEDTLVYPSDAYQHFMAHAWIAGTPPEELERYVDEPWTARGDFFYMQKLAETIEAYRGVKWETAK